MELCHNVSAPQACPSNEVVCSNRNSNRIVAAAEISKVVRLLDDQAGMAWAERWRWLHRIRGVVATLRAGVQVDDNGMAMNLHELSEEELEITVLVMNGECGRAPSRAL